MTYSSLLLISMLFSLCLIQAQEEDIYPAIAMVCGKNTQHRDIETGEWISDSSGVQNCIDDVAEMLEYCRKVYPDLDIVNVARQTTSVRIPAWCAIGNHGPQCRGHGHAVQPVRCITADHTPTLVTRTGCNIVTISDDSLCKGSTYWAAKAAERCQEEGKVLNDQRKNVMACGGVNKWGGIQFACCESKKPVPKFSNIDPVCTLPMVSGVCRAAFDAWYFDVGTGSCSHFTYGGCGGNDNRFTSLAACQERCENSALIVDPLLHLGVGPVLQDNNAESTTTASAQFGSDDKPTDAYFDAPLDFGHENEMYSNALMNELKDHQSKLNSILDQWDAAKTDVFQQGTWSEKGDQMNDDLQKELAALKNEHERRREQLDSAHQARVDASIVGTRTSNYNDLTNELNKPDVDPSKVIRAFRRYIQSESRDQHHTNKLLQHAQGQVSDATDALNGRLATIKKRVNNALADAQARLGPGTASDKLSELASNVLAQSSETSTTVVPPEIVHDDFIDYPNPPQESEEQPRLIDYGGLPPENVGYREEFNPQDWAEGTDIDDETTPDENFDNDFSMETPVPLNPMDFTVPSEIDDFDKENLDDSLNDPLPVQQWDEESYDEQNWLIWVGVAGSCLLLVVLVVAVVRAMGAKYGQRRQFARVEVEEQLTPEQQQLLQMQQNGYENPTYKFFEKQQQQQQA